jgi:transposase InsO family protein
VVDRCRFNGTETVLIDPGAPWQNAWIESFNGRLHPEFRNSQLFESPLEAQVLLEGWRIDYNVGRPQSADGCFTPVELAEAWTGQYQLQLHEGGSRIGVRSLVDTVE